jgi:restriction endonuclease S subunit
MDNSWPRVRLGEILRESKILTNKPDPSKRITVKLNVNGVEKRQLTNEIEGATKYYIRRKGQFIYGKQNLHKGAFGVVPEDLDGYESSADIPAFDVEQSCLPEWIVYYFKQNNFYLSLEAHAIGRGSRRIHPEQISDLEIPLPPIKIQKEILARLKDAETHHFQLSSEESFQLAVITKLRQSIIQEAIQGKLAPQNPNDDASTELLKKIKTENKFDPVTSKEEPYQLPNHWKWVRLGEICNKIGSGSTTPWGKTGLQK